MKLLYRNKETDIRADDIVIYWRELSQKIDKGLISIYRPDKENSECLRFAYSDVWLGADNKMIIDELFEDYDSFRAFASKLSCRFKCCSHVNCDCCGILGGDCGCDGVLWGNLIKPLPNSATWRTKIIYQGLL